MKIVVNIVLFLFLSFLALPTVASLMDDEADVSVAYSFAEEEIQKELKEVLATPELIQHFVFQNDIKNTTQIKSENLQRHDNVFEEIFSPPPEFI